MKLTDIVIRSLPVPPTASKIYADDSLTGFGVRVTKAGVKAFVLTYGVQRERVTIGRYPIIGLADARIEARRILAERTLGKFRPKRITFSDALELFLETRRQRNRPKTARETEKLLKSYFKQLHPMSLEDIRAHHVADLTDALSKKGLQSTASHAHTAVKTFLKFCAQRHYITSSPISEMEKPTLPKSRERVLTDDELRTVWKAVAGGGIFGDIVKMLILTGQRRSEIALLHPEWIDLDALACTLPTAITKNKRPHTFPIGSLSQALLAKSLMEGTTFLFPARGSADEPKPFNGWSKAKLALDAKATIAPWTLHDLRRTYATNLQRLGIRLEVIEALLNHVSGSRAGIVGVYNRHRYEAEMRDAVTVFDGWFTKVILAE